MNYKEYGKTGKKLSQIGFGGMRFPNDDGNYDLDYCAEMVKKAFSLGVNYFDTAPYYCHDKSQKIFGLAFKEMNRDEFYVSSKSSIKDPDDFRRQIESNLKTLGVEKIDFFHIWVILNLDDYRSREKAIKAAYKAKEEGLIEHVVASTHCNGDEIEIIANEGKFEGLTVGYNFMNAKYRQKGIEACYKNNMGVVTMNPLGGGLIPQNEEMFSFVKKNPNESIVEAALRFNMSHKEITVALAGMDSLESVIENVKSANDFEKYTQKEIDEIREKFGSKFDQLCTGCRYCDYCPQGIEIPKLLQAYNKKILTGKKEPALDELKNHFNIDYMQAADCVECGICESKCTQHLPIIERLKEISKW